MNMTARHAAWVLVGLGALAAAGCSLPITRQPSQTSYRLQATAQHGPDAVSAASIQPTVIHLLPLGAAPGLGGTGMLYSPRPGVLMPYRDSRWLAPPADLMRSALAQGLSRQPWVSAVEQDQPLAPADWTLHCELTRLEQDIHRGPGVVRLDLACQLAQSSPLRIVAHWQVDGTQPTAVNDAAHYAAAAQTLLDRAVQAVVQRVAAVLQRPRAG